MNEQFTLSDNEIIPVRKSCLRHLFVFAKTVLGYDDIIESLHGDFCRFLEGHADRKQATLPRGFVKTWLGTIAYAIWIALPRTTPDEFPPSSVRSTTPQLLISPPVVATTLPINRLSFVPLPGFPDYEVDPIYLLGTNIRILIASYVVGNAMKMIGLIRKIYERNQMMMVLFPEVIPENFTKVKWSDTESCINRPGNYTESTFEAGGIGGSTTSRHYDLIIEDDLIYANKDDFTGRELQPSQEDIDKAIGWHKLAVSLLVPGSHTKIHNIGTRWAKHDLVEYIRSNEPDYAVFERAATVDGTPYGKPTWPTMYDHRKIQQIYAAQGPYMFSTQYLNKPIAPEDMLFKLEWLSYYKASSEIPANARIFTTTDLSLWGKTVKKNFNSNGVVMTCAFDSNNHLWILRYDVGRFNPSEIIDLWYTHYKLFTPEIIGVEEVYYQKSILHFARLEMEKRGWLPIRGLKTSTSIDKDARIMALQPYALNGAIHCRLDHKAFISEYSEFVQGSSHCQKDILDTLAYQLQIARPGEIEQRAKAKDNLANYTYSTNMDKVLKELWHGTEKKGAFAKLEVSENAHLTADEELEFSELLAPLGIFKD